MLAKRDQGLRAGQIVLAGGATAAVALNPNQRVRVRVQGLGDASFLRQVASNMKIDLHTHILPPDMPNYAKKFGYGDPIHLEHDPTTCTACMMKGSERFRVIESNCWDVEKRLEECDRDGVSVQVLSTIPVLLTTGRNRNTPVKHPSTSTTIWPKLLPIIPPVSSAWERCPCRKRDWPVLSLSAP